jgi:hypothetical protein
MERGRQLFELAVTRSDSQIYAYQKWLTTLRSIGDPRGALVVADRAKRAGIRVPKDVVRDLEREARGR